MAVDAKYGRPNFPLRVTSEKGDATYVCCGYCSIQMVARVVKPDINDNMSGAAHEARACCGRPHNNGSNSSETRNGIWQVEQVDVNPCSTSEIPGLLKAGKAVQFCCEYGALPSYVKTQGGSFGHSVCLYGWTDANGGCVGFYDPLYSQDSNGLWARWSDIDGAGWGGDAHNASVKGAPVPPPDEPDCPDCPPCPPEGYTLAEANAMARSAVAHSENELVAQWMDWLQAPRPGESDRWDIGVWCGEDDIDPAPCKEGSPALWARSPILFPVADAREAIDTPGAWDSSDWRQSHWT